MEYEWIIYPSPNEEEVKILSQAINVNPYLSAILVQRGIKTLAQAKSYFRPTLDQLPDPFLMANMEKAVERLSTAIANQENILIYGDYDVDGTTSVALAYRFLSKLTPNIGFYVPDRYNEGYGVSDDGIRFAIDNEITLLITIDCGITAIKQVENANAHNIDVIICDHHIPGEIIPDALAVLNPKQKHCLYPFKELCGVGVAYKFLHAFCLQQNFPEKELNELLQLVAIGTCADIVPMLGENRILTYFGLNNLKISPLIGIQALLKSVAKDKELTTEDIVFKIAPRINSAGRMAHALHSVEVMIEDNEQIAQKWANEIEDFNINRRNSDADTTGEALLMLEEESKRYTYSTVLYDPDWIKGIIGIVASRCIENYYRPTIILTKSQDKLTGSARSINGVDLYKALHDCSDTLEQFGGHTFAAGLTLKEENLPVFKQRFEDAVAEQLQFKLPKPHIHIDIELPFSVLNDKFLGILKQMQPFGPGNMRPVFMTKNVLLKNIHVMKEVHVRLELEHERVTFKGIAFNFSSKFDLLQVNSKLDICYSLEENTFNNKTELQLFIRDIKKA